MKGIFFEGVPLDLEYVADIEIKEGSFTFHYIHRPIKERSTKRSSVRSSRVRTISKEAYQQLMEAANGKKV